MQCMQQQLGRSWRQGVAVGLLAACAGHVLADTPAFAQPRVSTPAAGCIALTPQKPGDHEDATIAKSGKYCVVQDFHQPKLSGAGHSGPSWGHNVVSVHGQDVTIDLQGHTLRSDYMSNGIGIFNLTDNDDSETATPGQDRIQRVTIRNGVIDLSAEHTNAGVEHLGAWILYDASEPVPTYFKNFERTEYVLENLRIKTSRVGVKLAGTGTVIRNCTIESAGAAAIILAGPDARILNNHIVLEHKLFGESTPGPTAAIVLRQASGAIISGNTISVRGGGSDRHAIYLRDGSKDVRVSDNVFVDVEPAVTLREGSVAQVSNNQFRRTQRRWWWPF